MFWASFAALSLLLLASWGLPPWAPAAVLVLALAQLAWSFSRSFLEWAASSLLASLAAGAFLFVRLKPLLSGLMAPYVRAGWQSPGDAVYAAGLLSASAAAALLASLLWLRNRVQGFALPAVFFRLPELALPVGISRPLGFVSSRKPSLDVAVAPGVVVKHADRYLHTVVVGTTGTGKTSRVLKPMIWQDLNAVASGVRAGVTVIEPKGDFAADVAEMARDLGLPVVFLNPEDRKTLRFNPMEGPAGDVAEIMRTVLQSLFGRQEAFFRQAQEVTCRNAVQLLKAVKGDDVTMLDMVEALRDRTVLNAYVEAYEKMYGEEGALSQFFRQELLGASTKMYEHILGLRLQLEDITGNELLRRVLMGKSDINLDRHLSEGGVLVVNTAMGRLGKLGDLFGQFVMMHFQYAVFRRPGKEEERTPHVLYVDEFSRYVNPDFERLLAIGRSFRCACVLALQTTSQLLLEERPAFRDVVLENCRNKIVLSLGSAEDAKRFAAEFGEDPVVSRSRTLRRDFAALPVYREEGVREDEKLFQRFPYTRLMELPGFTCVYRIVRDGRPLRPGTARLKLSEWDLRRARARRREILPAPPQGSRTEPETAPGPGPAAADEEPFF